MNRIAMDKKKKNGVHFIGIGGTGMSSLAQYFLLHGALVSGSDLKKSEITELLKNKGAVIYIGSHKARNVSKRVGRVIVSMAIDSSNPEYKTARSRRIPVRTYAEEIGELTKKYITIAVCGAHGKSTTTALVALALERAELDPTAIVGTRLHEWGGSNFRSGHGKYLVLEADEYCEAFHNYFPKIIIATNIDREHLDHYKTLDNIKSAFKKFFFSAPRGAKFILNRDNEYLHEIGKELSKKKREVVWYSLNSSDTDVVRNNLRVPGTHNVSNALAVLKLARVLKIEESVVLNVFRNFRGSWRRSEYKGMAGNARVYDDYAHHPTEIRATLAGFREMNPDARIWCVFQPHQQKRLELLFDGFVSAFHHADRIVLLDTFRVHGRDHSPVSQIGKKLSSRSDHKTVFDLARAIDQTTKKQVFYVPYPSQLSSFLKDSVLHGDIIIMMGAGDINELTPTILAA